MFYFGSFGGSGHLIFDENLNSINLPKDVYSLWMEIDGTFCPDDPRQREGIARLDKINGFTILAFWDRTGDSRCGSNSAFLWRGKLDFDQMLLEAQNRFPRLFKRFTFKIQQK